MTDEPRITKTYKPQHGYCLVRLEKAVTFTCVRCGKAKTSKLQATREGDPVSKVCNGCYGEVLAKK